MLELLASSAAVDECLLLHEESFVLFLEPLVVEPLVDLHLGLWVQLKLLQLDGVDCLVLRVLLLVCLSSLDVDERTVELLFLRLRRV